MPNQLDLQLPKYVVHGLVVAAYLVTKLLLKVAGGLL